MSARTKANKAPDSIIPPRGLRSPWRFALPRHESEATIPAGRLSDAAPAELVSVHNFGQIRVHLDRDNSTRAAREVPGWCPLGLTTPRAYPSGSARHARSTAVPAKLTIGQPNDRYEQEADRVAERVMRMPDPRVQHQVSSEDSAEEDEERVPWAKPPADQITTLIQRQVEPENEEEETVQMKRGCKQMSRVNPGLGAQIRSLSKGQPLSRSVRDLFEPRFGYSFSQVRIHTDAQAADAAWAAKAKAFTLGKDIVFGAGQYTPGTQTGRQLLAHELTHVIQQSRTGAALNRKAASPTSDAPSWEQLLSDLNSVDSEDVSPSQFCQPFPSKAKARGWHWIMQAFFIPLITSGVGPAVGDLMSLAQMLDIPIPQVLSDLEGVAQRGFGTEVGDLWQKYLTGSKKQERELFSDPASQIVQGFVNSEVTKETQERLVKAIIRGLPRSCRRVRHLRRLRPNTPTDVKVSLLLNKSQQFCGKEGTRPVCMNFYRFTEIPGNIAGGIGKSRYGKDTRRIAGKVRFLRITDATGKTTSVQMETGFKFVVRDAVDFCPLGTGDIGASIESILTVPLSRLEASGLAHDVPFVVRYSGKPIRKQLDPALVRRCWSK